MCNIIKRIRTTKKIVKMVINIAKDSQNMKERFTRADINKEGYIFDYSPASLSANKISIAGLQIINFGLFGDDLVPRIIYDDLFNDLSDNAKRFVIAHEMGHFKFHKQSLLSNSCERSIIDELEADRYAAEQIGYDNAIKALKEMKQLFIDISFGKENEASCEMEYRINAI